MIINVFVLQPLAALIGGILILIFPRLLNIVVAAYLILVGIVGLWPHFSVDLGSICSNRGRNRERSMQGR